MKNLKRKILVSLLIISSAISCLYITACSSNRYNLVSAMVGNADYAGGYEYSFIELNKEKHTYKLESKSKSNDVTTKQSGTYRDNEDGTISVLTNNEIPTMNYFLYKDEVVKLVGNTIVIYSESLYCTFTYAN